MTHIDFIFPKLRTPKTSLDKCLRSLVSEDMSTSNTVQICTTEPLSYILITAKGIELEKVSLIDMPNLATAC